ncbi:hypothetical protein VDG1235_934 [Verrucomicrobiia bacterium DG1235]|nr:hypothetical protein VDG1235_934 [Verrucomicrobiae bacterium DG1235]
MHSCCSTTATDTQATPKHAKADCPHDSEKHSQISETPDAHSTIAKTQASLLSVLYVLDFQVSETTVETTLATLADSPPIPPSSPLSESYCVYIL